MRTNQEESSTPSIDESGLGHDSGCEEYDDGLGGYASPESVDRSYFNDAASSEASAAAHEEQWRINHSSGDYKLRRK